MVKKTTALALAALMLEVAGRLAGLPLSDILYHHALYPRDKVSLTQKYNIEIAGTLEKENYPSPPKGANLLLEDQTVIKPVEDQYDLSRSFIVIANAIKNYPPIVIIQNLNRIYLLDELTLRGTKADGTYDTGKKSIYIYNSFNGNNDFAWGRHNLEATLHHEISSVLMKNYNFYLARWRTAIGNSFHYKKDNDPTYEWMLHHGYVDPVKEDILLERGLLLQYAETGVENDFNTYAEVIFTKPSRMSQLIQDYPLIAKKYHVFKAFYLSIDPGFAPVFEAIDGKIDPLKKTLNQTNTLTTAK